MISTRSLRRAALGATVPALFALAGCAGYAPNPPATAQVAVAQPPAGPVNVSAPLLAPQPPPAPPSEMVPPPPQGVGPVVWQPGHWKWNAGWVWVNGQYVPPPPGATAWAPGRWVPVSPPGTGYSWVEGHWVS